MRLLLAVLLCTIFLTCALGQPRPGRRALGRARRPNRNGGFGLGRVWKRRNGNGNNTSSDSPGPFRLSRTRTGSEATTGTGSDTTIDLPRFQIPRTRNGWNIAGFQGLENLARNGEGRQGLDWLRRRGQFARRRNDTEGRPWGRPSMEGVSRYSWRRQLSEGVTVREMAMVNTTSNTIVLISVDRNHNSDIHKAVTAFDFDKYLAAVRMRRGDDSLCVLVPSAIAGDFDTANAYIMSRNSETPVTPTTSVGEFIVQEGSDLTMNLPETSPILDRFCNRGRQSTILDATVELEDVPTSDKTQVLTPAGLLSIYGLPPL